MCQEIGQRFERIISGTLLAQNFIYRWLQLIFHVLGFRGHIPDQLLQSHRIYVVILQISVDSGHNGVQGIFNLCGSIGLISLDIAPHFT